MYPVIEQIAQDTGMSLEEAGYAFKMFTGELLNKVPQLEQVVEDVFADVETEKLNEHIRKVIVQLQKDLAGFKTWTMPETFDTIPHPRRRSVL